MWITSLNFAYENRNVDAMYCLLLDFPEVTDEELSKGIKEHHATLLFEIFQRNLVSLPLDLRHIDHYPFGRDFLRS